MLVNPPAAWHPIKIDGLDMPRVEALEVEERLQSGNLDEPG